MGDIFKPERVIQVVGEKALPTWIIVEAELVIDQEGRVIKDRTGTAERWATDAELKLAVKVEAS